ncbi:MAG: Gfo/Idh/MocA family oxidoreductase [Sphaerochaetaceae bacterium]|jgi:predicted dehydrogenase|nr:Gfo/Idh/MocA family oxidoreductase [Sphaerochaetaceae bacterium]NLO59937.1 Gfo/Idh/MocA family oxidoreductase [Spirochaetales bacterium]MDD2405507.1 Gfo/Idh/MocA family oxidoreductase [Sphaerochaetaceae bacterium]MDD3671229.1 Gfo/Idh/MocA family oxidoreductase [Sphaerochaetaceae bacterium]MDD4258946.1 Gfo/Idh/MocA family oxidoreductase [Sphaerochaetaceae bacterium]
MQEKNSGQSYAPKGKANIVCAPGEFKVGVIGLDHGHIYGMCNGLKEAGATIVAVYDANADAAQNFIKAYPTAVVKKHRDEILDDPSIQLVASAIIPSERGPLGCEVLKRGKDYFADKPPFTTLDQVAEARRIVKETGRIYGVYYSERLHVEAATRATELIEQQAIGRVVQVMGWGPHRASIDTRPQWFFDKKRNGGILVDIGCHQIEQILKWSDAIDGRITASRTANFNHKHYPGFSDFGDANIITETGCAGYFRVDWFTPDGLGTWGDGRTIILGTDGYIELRKYIDIAREKEGDHVYWVNHEGEQHECVAGVAGFPFFGQFVRDCLDRTETSASQERVFRAIELAIEAEEKAIRIEQ